MTKKLPLLHLALGVSFLLGTASSVLAQSANGSIRGTVLDPSGALVPRAEVTVSNAAGYSRTIKSDATGNFALPHLAPGTYSVSINATGFTPALDGGIQVAGDKVTREDIKLGISVNQQIEVSANDDASVAQTDSTDTTARNH